MQRPEGRAQVADHVRQGDVHDRDVDQEHERTQADRHQRQPLAHSDSYVFVAGVAGGSAGGVDELGLVE
jgi:hypothetical protein